MRTLIKCTFFLFIFCCKCLSQYYTIYHNDFSNGKSLNEWSTDKPIAGPWNNPIKIDSTPNGNRHFLGQFGQQSISLTLSNLPKHDSINIEFQLFVIKSWDGNDSRQGPDIFKISVDDSVMYQTTFSNDINETQDYPGEYIANAPKKNKRQTGANEINTLGYYHNGPKDNYYEYGDAVYYFQNQNAKIYPHNKDSIIISFVGELNQSASMPETHVMKDESWGISTVNISIPKCGIPNIQINSSVRNICKGDTLVLTAIPDSANYSYKWSNGDTSGSTLITDSGYYSVKITNESGCFDTTGIRIDINPKPIAGISGQNSLCKGDTIILNAEPDSASYSYNWANGENTRTIFVTDSGYYRVNITNQFGCSDTAGIRVDLNPRPVAGISGPNSFCKGDTIILNAEPDSASYSYNWANGENTRAIFVTDSGYYRVKITNQFGCSDTAGIRVDLNPNPVSSILGPNSLCKGDTINLNVEPDSAAYSFKWSNGSTSNSIFVTDSGNYQVIITNQYGCKDTENIQVNIKPYLQIKIDTTIADIGIDNISLFVKIKSIDLDNLVLSQIKMTISFDATSFLPYDNQDFIISNTIDSAGNRNLTLEADSVALSNEYNIIFTVKGKTLLGKFLNNKINITSVDIVNGNLCFDTIPGLLSLNNICVFNLRHVGIFNPTTMSVLPNPANDNVKINIYSDEDGYFNLKIYNIQGELIESKTWHHNKSETNNFMINLENLSSGLYQVIFRSPSDYIVKELLIIK